MSSSLFKPNSGTGLQAIGGKKGKGPLDPNKKNAKNNISIKEERAPHEIAEYDMASLGEAKTQQLYQWYCEIQLKLNKV